MEFLLYLAFNLDNLVKEKQFLGSDKRFLTDDSVGLERIVIPNLRPLTAIQMIAQRAKTKKDSKSSDDKK